MNFFGSFGSNNCGCDSCSILILLILLQCLGGGNGNCGIDICTLLLILLLTGNGCGTGCMNKC